MDAETSVPAGERVLWRGAPDAERVMRRWLRTTLAFLGWQVISLAIFLTAAGVALHIGTVVPLAGFLGIIVVPQLLSYFGVRRDVRQRSYTLTDESLVIESRTGRQELRLVNLPDLRLELDGDGYGSILFTPPAGATAERYLRRLARWVPQVQDSSVLLTSVANAEQVMGLLRHAQSAALAVAGSTPSPTTTVPSEAAIAQQPFMRSAGMMPFWFGAGFLVMGLIVLVWVAAVGLSGVRDWWPPAIVGAPFAVIGALFIRARYVVVREQRRLARAGVRVTARVIDAAATGTLVNDVEQWILRYRFEVRGREYTGQSAMQPWGAVAGRAPGDPIAVLYDPANPSLSAPAEGG